MGLPIVAVVMAGGTGTRLYPASREGRPKQFRSFGGDRSLLSRTVERCSFADEVLVSTAEHLVDGVSAHAPDADVLVEPAAKDTGPALAYATFWCRELLGECVVLAVPSDHVVGDGFEETARTAVEVAAETDSLVTIGIDPDRPATEYGYIEPGEKHDRYYEVDQFREKPDPDTAADLVKEGSYWNAGMFAWRADVFLDAVRESQLAPLVDALEADDPIRGFRAVESVSVDYAVMERAESVSVVPAPFDWDDVGSWDALSRVLGTDEDGNTILGDVLAVDATSNVVASEDHHVSVVGVDDLVVAAFDDRVLVVPKDDAQRVRDVVARLREEGQF